MRKAEMSQENLIPVPAETVRRVVESSVKEARNLRERGLNYSAQSVQQSASEALERVNTADGEFVSLPESDLTTLTARGVRAGSDDEYWDARNNMIKFRKNQHEYHE
jgi:hypothetical protein